MAYENNKNYEERRNSDSVFSKRIKAGKRRTYFFDVRETRSNDYFITITESKKKFNDDGYERHKMFLYKEDFNKFLSALTETVDHVKTELMPDFDFDAFNHIYENGENGENYNADTTATSIPESASTSAGISSTNENNVTSSDDTDVDDWKM